MVKKIAINGGVPVRKNYLSYGSQWIDNDDVSAVVDVLKSDWLTQGPNIAKFENEIAKYCNSKFAVAFSSGTSALHAATYASGISKGDEAITTPITFAADGNCVLYMDGIVKFADIKPDTFNIDPVEIKKMISSKTKLLLPVDFAGQPCDIDDIKDLAEENDILLIEDASHAIGSIYKNKKVGGLADLTVFSFHPVKTITTGEGGMVLTNQQDLYERLLLFRTHGITKNPKKLKRNEGGWYYEMHDLGYNYRITDFQCALGLSQFKRLEKFIKRRRAIVKRYNEGFSDLKEIITPFEKPDVKSAFHLYVIQLNLEMLNADRKNIFDSLRSENIGVHVHYIPLHLQPYYMREFGYKKGDFPIAENYYSKALTLPLFPKMKDEDIVDVIEAVKKVIRFYSK